jgi:beta-galactosidase/beta-glucuronidase
MQRRDFLASMGLAGVQRVLNGPRSSSLLSFGVMDAQDPIGVLDEGMWPRPLVLPIPVETAGVKQPCVILDGKWQINAAVSGEFWSELPESSGWVDIAVPGQADKQGVAIKRDVLYAYRTSMKVPSDFAGKRIFLRFESVSGIATPYINGLPLEQHLGGFTIWSREITEHVVPGEMAHVAIGVLDPIPAHWSCGFDSGGICRSVKLIALPQNYMTRLHVETDLDKDYRNALLRVETQVQLIGTASCHLELHLVDPHGSAVPLAQPKIEVTTGKPRVSEIPVAATVKWDAEHPNLYTLEARLYVNGEHEQTIAKKFGVRKIELSGAKVTVNGMEIKLRGGGRFDSNPLLGHTLSAEQCDEEVRIFKDANLNYLRPACYPASEAYLEACDRYGMYVEGETAVTFTRGTESDPKFTPLFMDQMAAMIEANRDHPCILHWSLGNESSYGINIAKTFEYTQQADPSRPVLFSWSHSIPPDKPLPFTIYSYHYPDFNGNLGKAGVNFFNGGGKMSRPIPEMPILHDEIAHGPCFDFDELKRDPNIHNFWGESIKLFWEGMYRTPGCLGGSIWAVVNESGMGSHVYDWGMVDLWRRKKPEYWLMKKAYSPVRINDKAEVAAAPGKVLALAVANWHDHTNLNELRVRLSVNRDKGEVTGPDIPPGGTGELIIPARSWKAGEEVYLAFIHGERIVDEYMVPIEAQSASQAAGDSKANAHCDLTEDKDKFTIAGSGFRLTVDKITGGIQADSKGKRLIESGPSFHLIGADMEPWALDSVAAKQNSQSVAVEIAGHHGSGVQVKFHLEVRGDGDVSLHYDLPAFNLKAPELKLVPWNRTSTGGFSEVGLSFSLTSRIDRLDWKRAGLHSVYPEDHIGRNKGVALRTKSGIKNDPNVKPDHPWSDDQLDFNLFGPNDKGGRGSNDFRSMKEYIEYASAQAGEGGPRLHVQSDKSQAVRLEVEGAAPDGNVKLIVNDLWNYANLGLGNYMKAPIMVSSGYSGKVKFRLG